jgi:hypothetical protein
VLEGERMRRIFLASLFTVVLLSTQMADAAVFVGQTNLTIHVRGQTVSGKLVGRPECRPNQTIELWIDGVLQDTTQTDGRGNYSFDTSIAVGDDVQTRFQGSRTGEHPDRFICAPSNSRIVVIKHLKDSHGEERTGGPTPSARQTFSGLAQFLSSLAL